MEATAGRPDAALAAAQDALRAGHAARLRSFVPALRAYAAQGRWQEAFEVRIP